MQRQGAVGRALKAARLVGTATPAMAHGGASVLWLLLALAEERAREGGEAKRNGGVGRSAARLRLRQAGPVGTGRPAVPRGELAGAWPPRGVRALAPVGAWARRTGGTARRQAGPACAAGPKRRRRPIQGENGFFQFLFSPKFIQTNFFELFSKQFQKLDPK